MICPTHKRKIVPKNGMQNGYVGKGGPYPASGGGPKGWDNAGFDRASAPADLPGRVCSDNPGYLHAI